MKTPTFRSRFEKLVWDQLPPNKTEYEAEKIPYALEKYYVPDFKVVRPDGHVLYIEAKGYLRAEDRMKMLAVKDRHPELDIRFVFVRDNKLRKGSKTTYSEWAKRHGFKYAIGNVPRGWFSTPRTAHEQMQDKIEWLYGITIQDRDALLAAQGGACAICGDPFTKTPHVDHDHKTGKVRGLLCHLCNTGIGKLRDNVRILEKAIKYLNG